MGCDLDLARLIAEARREISAKNLRIKYYKCQKNILKFPYPFSAHNACIWVNAPALPSSAGLLNAAVSMPLDGASPEALGADAASRTTGLLVPDREAYENVQRQNEASPAAFWGPVALSHQVACTYHVF